ncbi:hypothetical protein KQI41_18660 [Tissierella pigra]|uniref:hypothetical protein n=1 Tax=Tissierella pigra TaxID=2607614 RepID=UPI001C1091AA|nr:hypothetical protein [Tissierella pigra]MBU5428415.1 hypothetical protein [Tissierella pigra]
MKIIFFETSEGLDKRAAKGGIYHIELLNNNTGQAISLYIGESVWVIERCGTHLYKFFNDPNYLGLTEDDLINNNLSLRFSMLEKIDNKKSVLGKGSYKKIELEYIKDKKPLTQLRTSDRQIRDINDKVKRVQDEMKKHKFI